MATMKTILAALKLVDAKKENLRKAFEDLRSHSSTLSSFDVSWSDLDSYFTSLQSSLEHKFKILRSQQEQKKLQPSQPSNFKPSPIQARSQSRSIPSNSEARPVTPQSQTHNTPEPQSPNSCYSKSLNDKEWSDSAPARPELKSFCQKMDGLGLRKYIAERPKGRNTIKVELQDALQCAPDAAAMVLDAMEGFYVSNSSKGDEGIELPSIRRSCAVLLAQLTRAKVEIGAETREKAKNLAVEWKGKVNIVDGDDDPLEALAFLHLLAAYGVSDAFDVDELIDLAVEVARFREAVELFRVLSFGDKMSDIVLKLCSKGKQFVAVRLILEFELSAQVPPVPLLEGYVDEAQRLAKKAIKDKKNTPKLKNEALAKEANAYKSVIKLIEDYNLEYDLKEKLMKRLEIVENLKSNMKSNAVAPASRTQLQSKPQKLSGSKRPRNTPPAHPTAIPMSIAATSSTVPAFQHSHQQPEGLLPKHLPSYLGSPAGPYGLADATASVAPYAGSSAAGQYGSAGAPFRDPGNSMPSQPHVYPSESNMATDYYDSSVAYGGYDLLPQYHQPYYPQ